MAKGRQYNQYPLYNEYHERNSDNIVMKRYVLTMNEYDSNLIDFGYISEDCSIVQLKQFKSYDIAAAFECLKRYSIIGENEKQQTQIYTNIVALRKNELPLFDFIMSMFVIFGRQEEPKTYNLIELLNINNIPYEMNHDKDFKFPYDISRVVYFRDTNLYIFMLIYQMYLENDKLTDDNKIREFIDNVTLLFYNSNPENCPNPNSFPSPGTMKYTIDLVLNGVIKVPIIKYFLKS